MPDRTFRNNEEVQNGAASSKEGTTYKDEWTLMGVFQHGAENAGDSPRTRLRNTCDPKVKKRRDTVRVSWSVS